MTLGQVILDARKNLLLSQKDLAALIRKEDAEPISPQYLNDIEHNRRSPSEQVLKEIAHHLKLNPDYLYFLAGQLPADLRDGSYKPERVQEAFKAFRRALKKGSI